MQKMNSQTSQKLRGGYYTPKEIVEFLVSWVMNQETITSSILEPSAGDGAFIDGLLMNDFNGEVIAIELIEEEANKIAKKIEGRLNFNILNMDFYDYYEEVRNQSYLEFDAVIGNPPYIRYQYLTDDQRNYQGDILLNNGLEPNKLINAWVAFVVASIELLKSGGHIALVLPTDLLQVGYAKQLRKFLFNNLSMMTIVTFQELVFEGIQQDVVLLLGEKREDKYKASNEHFLRILHVDSINELTNELLKEPYMAYEEYESDKWTKFYLNREDREFYEGLYSEKTVRATDFAKIEVGVTTGNNNFFAITDSVLKENQLENYRIPLLGRSVDTFGLFYTVDDHHYNARDGKKVWLLDFNGKKLSGLAKRYISEGERNGENVGYKLSLRKRWYDVPSIWRPDAFLLRRIGAYPKLVANQVEATSTDTFHRIKFACNVDEFKFYFLFYSSITLLSFELEGRIFGGGALEVLPGDMKNIKLPQAKDDLPYQLLTNELDYKLRQGECIESIVSWVDSHLAGHTAFSKSEIERTYRMWNYLKKKRMQK